MKKKIGKYCEDSKGIREEEKRGGKGVGFDI